MPLFGFSWSVAVSRHCHYKDDQHSPPSFSMLRTGTGGEYSELVHASRGFEFNPGFGGEFARETDADIEPGLVEFLDKGRPTVAEQRGPSI